MPEDAEFVPDWGVASEEEGECSEQEYMGVDPGDVVPVVIDLDEPHVANVREGIPPGSGEECARAASGDVKPAAIVQDELHGASERKKCRLAKSEEAECSKEKRSRVVLKDVKPVVIGYCTLCGECGEDTFFG